MAFLSTTELYEVFLEHPRVCTDTRALQQGDLFIALRGERFDGNQFAKSALEQGAAFALVDDPEVVSSEQFLLVEDALASLQDLARHHRRQLEIPVIAITGSNGKTTTKELTAAVMNSRYRTPFTQGNLNNHIGVPLSLLRIKHSAEAAIIEMGANHQREIDFLCRIAEPTHGLITNIGYAHLEGFGGLEGVKKGKSELYQYLAETGGVAFVNEDEQYLEELAKGVGRVIYYHDSAEPSPAKVPMEIKSLRLQPSIQVAFLDAATGELIETDSHLSGKHNLQNIKTAVAVGKYFKIDAPRIARAIATYVPQNNRSQWTDWRGIQVLLDAYNANPSSMRASLENFSRLAGGPKLAILGDMLELGDSSVDQHQALASWAQSLPLKDLVLVGPLFSLAGTALGIRHFDSIGSLQKWFDPHNWEDGQILIKGSRGMALERLIEAR